MGSIFLFLPVLIYPKIENALGGFSEVFLLDVTLTFVAEFLTTFGDPEEKSNKLSSSSFSSILFFIGFDNGLSYSGYEVFYCNTVEKFLLLNFLWSHTPCFGHILLHIHYKM